MGYNGWSNYDTWLINLWLSNDAGWYSSVMEMAESAEDAGQLAYMLEDLLSEAASEAVGDNGLFCDIVSASLRVADFREIAESWLKALED